MAGAFRFMGVILVLAGLGFVFTNWAMGAGLMAGGVVLLLLTAGSRSAGREPGSTAARPADRAEPGAAPDRRGT